MSIPFSHYGATALVSRLVDDAELLHHAYVIRLGPAFDDLAIFEAEYGDSLNRKRFSSCRNAHEFALVCSGNRHPAYDFVTFRDLILDRPYHVRKGQPPSSKQLFEAFKAGPLIWPCRIMVDKIRSQQIVCNRQVSIGNKFLEKATDDGFVFF